MATSCDKCKAEGIESEGHRIYVSISVESLNIDKGMWDLCRKHWQELICMIHDFADTTIKEEK